MGKTIFVVDDSKEIRQILKYYLEKTGYEVMEAVNGKEALQMLTSKKADLILLDIMMPEMDGFNLAKKLKEDESTRGIPIIMLTAKGEKADVIEGIMSGAEDYVLKPFKKDIVLAKIKKILDKTEQNT